ncbi:haloacid dehalogenase superfamily, subfamily IA, variant 3 with third motif having DD or ED/haloacid dehalogenase superfamily, subfamily IA, variant 1 with third motif having Dx(3-4)D or Dx(3-4)E [Catalinimonas alkaloidigena]|uniref:Haloacid dehalogenase superfamily, subfamily IA, variant 3 with third motif having DD or ED/haloacid dehalogenase superfamily, subfamily IA, variant 1 with third motif having Dx(3-4)D or Dx(3-4)E n=2 Tax=Catalinimonas alkaloidigena TaxID=1075417 RepID=A0A1G9S692_9BACT|nr:haloacid dehalogenase superfamily, subfamily IA, variant 3 with third motif having DD or ED/haloacid dehalogenase superfamily, subfamily IA, variant 1 with third motif having Dx(3-4)D or Dx(3-4)E [Catalinimonas alkaloidigena]
MDGTMVDNMMVHHRAWQQKLAEVGLSLSLDEVVAKCHGTNDDILVRLFGDKYTFEERDAISYAKEALYREVFLPDLKLVDGLHRLLDEGKKRGLKMGIGTAARPENVDFVVDTLGIRDYFGAIVTAHDVTKGKPDPEVFLKVADQLGVAPEHCLVFEDSPTGAKTAYNAGMKCIVITTTHRSEEFTSIPSVRRCVPDYTSVRLEEELIS